MFSRITLYSFLALALAALLWGALCVRVRPRDIAAFRRLQQKEEKITSQGALQTTQQRRKNVKKDLFFAQEDGSRLHYRILSRTSLLTIEPCPLEKKIELKEKLENIECWMQDKLYSSPAVGPMQQIRSLQAEEGTYCYTTQQFLAQTVALSLYRLPGEELPSSVTAAPFLKGIAQDVSFAVSGKTPNFRAEHFKAELVHK